MKRLFVAISLIAITFSVLVWRLPASTVLAALPADAVNKVAPFVTIHELGGTIWSGDARISVSAIPSTQRIVWNCAPKRLALAIDCALSEAISGVATIDVLSQSITLNNVKTAVPFRFVAPGATIVTSDQLSATVANASLSAKATQLTATITAVNTATRIGETVTLLGEVSLDCAPIDAAPGSRCTLRNRASENRIDGQIDLNPNRVSGNVAFAPAGAVRQSFSF